MIDDLQRVNDEYKKEGLTEDLVIESATWIRRARSSR